MTARTEKPIQQRATASVPADNGYLATANSPSPPSSSPVSPSAPADTSSQRTTRRINPSQFCFTPMRQTPKSPLCQSMAYGSGSGSNSSSGNNTPVGDTFSQPKPGKKVHIAPPVGDENDDETPCFIHSGLDKHGSLQDWLRSKHEHHFLPHPHNHKKSAATGLRNRLKSGPAGSSLVEPSSGPRPGGGLTPQPSADAPDSAEGSPMSDETTPRPTPASPSFPDLRGVKNDEFYVDTSADTPPDEATEYDDEDDDDEPSSSLTRQLAATAQGVREVSKELGRTTVHSRIQHILIVTKARDNALIRLTRELALYLMQHELPHIPSSAASSVTDLLRGGSSDTKSERYGNRRVVVYVDAQLRTSKRFDAEGLQRDYPHLFEPIPRRRSSSTSASSVSLSTLASSWSANGYAQPQGPREDGQLRYWTAEMCSNSPQLFDFVVTLGGDGTVLFTSWLFQKIVPPVLPFALGSLGFLTNFNFKDHRKTMDRVINEGIRVNLRMRFTATVYRAVAPEESMTINRRGKRKAIRRPGGDILVQQVDRDGWESLEGGVDSPKHTSGRDKEIMCFTTRPVEQFEVLNDLVVDRGPSPFVSLLEVFGDDHHLTTVQADGLTVSTPTGSTAYSLSAGGSLVHPQIPALLLTPICPHTLSFRPMLLPDSMELRVCVPYNSRSTAWASFDGRGRIELKQGDHIKITASKYPFPTVCADKQSTDWFRSISRTLKWNERERQKSFVVVEEDAVGGKHLNDDDYSDDDDDDDDGDGEYYSEVSDEFDIDDRSGGETPSPPGAIPIPQAAIKRPHLRTLAEPTQSGVQSPDRFASHYRGPPPISQRHLLEKLATVESQLRHTSLDPSSDTEARNAALEAEEEHDDLASLPEDLGPGLARCESDATIGGNEYLDPSYEGPGRHGRSDSVVSLGSSRTPRQGRSRSRSRHRGPSATRSRSGSPAVGAALRHKTFAFFGHDDSTSEVSDHSE